MPSTSTSTGTTPVHRVRFVDYDPSPITALVFPPLPFPSADPGIAHAQQQIINKKIRTTVGTPELTPELVAAAEFGCLICARQNGQIDIWEYVGSSKNGNPGNWVLSRVSSDKRREHDGESLLHELPLFRCYRPCCPIRLSPLLALLSRIRNTFRAPM